MTYEESQGMEAPVNDHALFIAADIDWQQFEDRLDIAAAIDCYSHEYDCCEARHYAFFDHTH